LACGFFNDLAEQETCLQLQGIMNKDTDGINALQLSLKSHPLSDPVKLMGCR